jgi:hypothetical protein
MNMVTLTGQPHRFWTWGKRNGQIDGQATAARPPEEVAYRPASGGAFGEPLIEVNLGEFVQGLATAVQPGQ